MAPGEAAGILAELPTHAAVRAWQVLGPDVARAVLEQLPEPLAHQLLSEAEPVAAAAVAGQWDLEERERRLARLDPQVSRELHDLLRYPERSAGRLMDTDASPLHESLSVGQALARLRSMRRHGMRELFVVDDEGQLTGRVEIQDLAVTDDARPLREVTRPLIAAVQALDPQEEVVALLQQKPITEVPVVNVDGRFVGVIRHAALVSAIEQASSVDI
ncbi:MAG: CBS domain-containing protein, partial [Usitatibacter sp.]